MGKIVLQGGQGSFQAGKVKQWLWMVKKVYLFIYLNSITPSYKTNLHGESIKHDTLKWQSAMKKVYVVSQLLKYDKTLKWQNSIKKINVVSQILKL